MPPAIAGRGWRMRNPLKDILRLLKLTRPFVGTYSTAMAALVVGSVAFLLIPNQLGRLIALVAILNAVSLSNSAIRREIQ